MKDNNRVPVVGADSEPRMSTKCSRARRWMKEGKAIPKFSKIGVFYVQLTQKSGKEKQEIALGLDPGSSFDGVAVVSKNDILITGMLELPKDISYKMDVRRAQRKLRRYRKWRRPCRFDNRSRPQGWIAPSQKSKIDFKLKIIKELKKLYPISKAIVEDVRFNHYKSKQGKFFSTVEIGKQKLYDTLREWFTLKLMDGHDTADLRQFYYLSKSNDKSEHSFYSHAVDALVLGAWELGMKMKALAKNVHFFVWKRYRIKRRQLHKLQFEKGGIKKREGGSYSLGFKKGDIVLWKDKIARIGGNMNGKLSLHSFNVANNRFTQNANTTDCLRVFNQRIMYSCMQFLPQLVRPC